MIVHEAGTEGRVALLCFWLSSYLAEAERSGCCWRGIRCNLISSPSATVSVNADRVWLAIVS